MLVLDMCHTVVSCPYARPCAYPGECPASVQLQVFIGDNGTRNAMTSQIYDDIGRNLTFIAVVYKLATKFTMVW
jgi:hypothetical protein